jgi:hypothetical protein
MIGIIYVVCISTEYLFLGVHARNTILPTDDDDLLGVIPVITPGRSLRCD